MTFWPVFPTAMVIAFIMTGVLRRYAVKRRLLDIPNQRSSHVVPTPRGGGLAFVISFLLFLPLLTVPGLVTVDVFWALAGAGSVVALVGFWDDHRNLSAGRRLLVHFSAAAWLLSWLGGLPPLEVLGTTLDLGWAGHVLAAVYLVWLVNLYNFMDGIDGIAAVEAITVCMGGVVLYTVSSAGETLWVLPALFAAAVTGFLFWNFPKARIFMGDVGSGFIGIVLGGFSIAAAWEASELFWAWIVLLGAFVVDATLTLGRRVWRGEACWKAHRSHAYQHAAQKFSGHGPVTLTIAGLNLVWLLPLAVLVVTERLNGVIGVVCAYSLLVVLALYFRAGEPE